MPIPQLAVPPNGLFTVYGMPFKTIKVKKSFFKYYKYKNKLLMGVAAWDNPVPKYDYPKDLEVLEIRIINENLKTFFVPEGVKHLHLVGDDLGKIKIPTLPNSLVSFSIIDYSKSIKIPDLSYLPKLKYAVFNNLGLTKIPSFPKSITNIRLSDNKFKSFTDDKLLEKYPKLILMTLSKKYLRISPILEKKYDGILKVWRT